MKRLHLFEFNDMPGTPRVIKQSITEILGLGLRYGHIYDGVLDDFIAFCEATEAEQILDLCSGSGEPVSGLLDGFVRRGATKPTFILSDLYPHPEAMARAASRHPDAMTYLTEPLDATKVPTTVPHQARTIICAFHHFPPSLASRIVYDCVANGKGLFILEAFNRSVSSFLTLIPLFTPFLLVNPFITPSHKLSKFLLTYVLPVVPLTALWDGIISALRIYNAEELITLGQRISHHYTWDYAEYPMTWGRSVRFQGIPLR